MIEIFPLLARDETDWGKVLPAIIFFVLWGLGALANAFQKKKEKERRERVAAELKRRELQTRQPAPQALPLPPTGARPQRTTIVRPPQKIKSARIGKLTPPRRLPAAQLPIEAAPEPEAPTPSAPITATQISPSHPRPAGRSTSASAAAVRSSLNARTLRSQFILTELLQPPLALREPKDL